MRVPLRARSSAMAFTVSPPDRAAGGLRRSGAHRFRQHVKDVAALRREILSGHALDILRRNTRDLVELLVGFAGIAIVQIGLAELRSLLLR